MTAAREISRSFNPFCLLMEWSAQYERLPVYGSEAAIATSHPAATSVGLNVLASGGNSVDAALAAHAVLCVVEPGMTGIGGDCFVLLHRTASQTVIALNGSGYAPMGALNKLYGPGTLNPTSPHSVTVPGAVDAWCRLSSDFGTRDLAELFAPAIRLAREGYRVHSRVAFDWKNQSARLGTYVQTAASLLKDGRAPRAGEIYQWPQLANTLEAIGRKGRAAFYEGEVARNMVGTLRQLGGLHTLEDFADCRSEYVQPISTDFSSHTILECPPNGQGVIALLLLNILSCAVTKYCHLTEADYHHLLAEATKQAYKVRDEVLSDGRFMVESTSNLLDPLRAQTLAQNIVLETVGSFTGPSDEHSDTTYLCCVDRDGNAISFINSLFQSFGSCIVAPDCGVLFNNRGMCFSVIDGHPNCIGPRKRPLQTIIPGMILDTRGRAISPFGIMGGHYQAAGHAAFVLNTLVKGCNVQQAINAPRAFATDGFLEIEPIFDANLRPDLVGRGHRLAICDRPIGGAQAIWIDHATGTLTAASDPRKDGCALAL